MKIKKIIKRLVITFAFVFSIMGSHHTIYAAEPTFTILPGPLTLDYPVKHVEMTYHKETRTFYGEISTLVVTDATGSGVGWHIDVMASPVMLTYDNGKIEKLPEGFLTLHKGGAKMTSNGGKFPHFFDSNYIAIDKGEPVKILTANTDEGMGQFHIDFAPKSLQLYVPNYEEDNTYYSTITFSITQGP